MFKLPSLDNSAECQALIANQNSQINPGIMKNFIKSVRKNAKPQLKIGVSVSVVLFVIFFVLQYYDSRLLMLDNKWIAVSLFPIVLSLLLSGIVSEIKVLGMEVKVVPSKTDLENANEKIDYQIDTEKPVLPSDYYYLKHTSFYRKEAQEDLQKKTGLKNLKLYDIRVKLFSYYKGAFEKIDKVEYYLHSSYEHPRQLSTDKKNNFELKELAYGEYVLSAKVFVKNLDQPFIVQRYITLWDTGPRI